jgi:DNA-binding transcriptional ArsR family regulator
MSSTLTRKARKRSVEPRVAGADAAVDAAVGSDALDATFFALSSEIRRRMLDVLKREGGSNVNALAEQFAGEIGRFAVMKHIAVLERGGLLISAREGREKKLWFDATPIQLIHERWTTEFSAYWAARLTRLKYDAEGALVHRLAVAPKTSSKTSPKKERRHG